MTVETVKYQVKRNQNTGSYVVTIYRSNGKDWNEMHQALAVTMWGGKFYARRWIKKWAKGEYQQHSYMDLVTVDREW